MSDTEAPSIRDSLMAAMEESEAAPAPVADDVTPSEATPVEVEAPVTEGAPPRARDDSGRFARSEKRPEPAKVTTATPVKPAPTVAQSPVAPPAPAVEMKAPQSWRGPAKETWAALPEAARVEVLRREKEIATQMAQLGEDRKFAASLRSTLAPYEAQIRAEGSTPEKAVGNLLNTAMALRTAPPAHKASLVAGIIRDFGVPLDGLVAALQGQPVPEQQAAPAAVDPRHIAQQVEQALTQKLMAQREHALMSKFTGETEAFLEKQPLHGPDGTDYGDDIREDMADIIERAARRGRAISLEQAYSLAARQHPEVSKVLVAKERAAQQAQAPAAQRARVAAASVRHSPATTPIDKGARPSLRESLEAAFSERG